MVAKRSNGKILPIPDQNSKIELSQLKGLFASEMIITNRKLQETIESLTQLMSIHNEMMKQLEPKAKKKEDK